MILLGWSGIFDASIHGDLVRYDHVETVLANRSLRFILFGSRQEYGNT